MAKLNDVFGASRVPGAGLEPANYTGLLGKTEENEGTAPLADAPGFQASEAITAPDCTHVQRERPEAGTACWGGIRSGDPGEYCGGCDACLAGGW